MKKAIIVVVIMILVILLGINKYPNSIEKTMLDSNISANQILHEVTMDKDIVIFL